MIEAASAGGMTQRAMERLEHVPYVTGTVVGIHRAHHWFRVRFVTPSGEEYHECFPEPQQPVEIRIGPPIGRRVF